MNELIQWILNKTGFKVPAFLANINKDKLTTWLGFGEAGIVGALTYVQTGFDPNNFMSWVGLYLAVSRAVSGYATNKPAPPANVKVSAPAPMISPVLVLAMIGLSLTACSGVSRVVTDEGGGRVRVMETKRDSSAFGIQTATVQPRWCDGQKKVDANGLPDWEVWGCADDGDPRIFSTQGWFLSLFQPAAIGGGMVGAGALIGGSSQNVNQSGGTQTQSNTQNVTQGKINGGIHH